MNRASLMEEYFESRKQKRALAEEFKAKMAPLCLRIKKIEELLEGASCRGCDVKSTRPMLTIV